MFEIRTDNINTKTGGDPVNPHEVQDLHEWNDYHKSISSKDTSIVVAVMDSGIDKNVVKNHGWFGNSFVGKRKDFTGTREGEDKLGHGTGVASIISKNTSGVEFYSIKVFGGEGNASSSTIKNAYNWLINHASEIDIVNISWGAQSDVPEINNLHEKLINKGVHDVVAAGNCLPANTWILTGSGWRRMHNIYRMGEGTKVISYNEESEKFESDTITDTFKREMNSDEKLLRIHTEEDHVIEVTEDHELLTSNGYKKAKNLSTEDEIIIKPDTEFEKKAPDFYDKRTNPGREGIDHAKGYHPSGEDHVQYKKRIEVKCPNCGKTKKLIPHRAKNEKGFCSSKCSSEYNDLKPPLLSSSEARKNMPDNLPEIGEKALKGWRENNPEKHRNLAKNEEFRKNMGDGSNFPHSEELARKGALAAHKKISKWKTQTSIEKELSNVLDSIGIEYHEEYIIKKKGGGMLTSIDFAIPERSIAIYVDGNYWHNYPEGTETDKKITEELESRGWKVVRFWGSDIRESLEEVKNKLFEEITNGAKVTKIEEIDNKNVYDISVENNHNFIANGLVVHNSGSDGGSPATAEKAFSVGATNDEGDPVRFSSFDPDKGNPDIAAVGKDVAMAKVPGTSMGHPIQDLWVRASGTSFSAPIVTAAYVNALYSEKRNWDQTLMNAAPDIPGTKRDGGGLLKLKSALDNETQNKVVDASVHKFKDNETIYIDASWLSSGKTNAEKVDETKDYVDIRIKK